MSTSKNPPVGLVLIHGAGLANWAWRKVVPHLKVPYVLAELPARGQPKKARKDLSLEDYTNEVCRQMEHLTTPRVVIVGHSIGGVVGLELAQILGDRLAGFVAISAVMPKPGNSFLSTFAPFRRWALGALLHTIGTQPPKKSIKTGVGSDLTAKQAEQLAKNYNAEALRSFTDPTAVSLPSNIASLYILTTRDQALPPKLQPGMAANMGRVTIVSFDSGHLPMMTQPKNLATELNNFVKNL